MAKIDWRKMSIGEKTRICREAVKRAGFEYVPAKYGEWPLVLVKCMDSLWDMVEEQGDGQTTHKP